MSIYVKKNIDQKPGSAHADCKAG